MGGACIYKEWARMKIKQLRAPNVMIMLVPCKHAFCNNTIYCRSPRSTSLHISFNYLPSSPPSLHSFLGAGNSSLTPAIPFLQTRLTFSSNPSLTPCQSIVCNFRTFDSNSAFQRSLTRSDSPARVSLAVGGAMGAEGETMLVRSVDWCRSRADWWARVVAW